MARCGEAGALLSPFATGSVPIRNEFLDRHLARSKEKWEVLFIFPKKDALLT